MIILFEDFKYDDIKKYLRRTKTGQGLVPNVSFDVLDEEHILNPKDRSYMKYNSLIRFLVYYKLLTYEGNNPTILKYIAGIKSGDLEKSEIINKIGNNNHVLDAINKKFNLGIPDYKYAGEAKILDILNNYKKIFNDINFKDYIDIVFNLSEKAKLSEKIVKGVVVMIYGDHYDIQKAELADDLRGVDIWMVDKKSGEKRSMQVKNIPGSLNIRGADIYVNNTRIDLHNFVKKTDDDYPPYDYLAFFSEKDKKVCVISGWAIYSIDVNKEQRSIHIGITVDGMEDYKNAVKVINVPFRFLPKDYDKIFY